MTRIGCGPSRTIDSHTERSQGTPCLPPARRERCHTKGVAELVGRIVVVQESRFRLSTPAGQSFLLTLHRGAYAELLRRYQRDKCQVRVDYSGEPGLDSGLARAVVPMKRFTEKVQQQEPAERTQRGPYLGER